MEKTYLDIVQSKEYREVSQSFDRFMDELEDGQMELLRSVFYDVIDERLQYDGYADISLFLDLKGPKAKCQFELEIKKSVVYKLYCWKITGGLSDWTRAFHYFWEAMEPETVLSYEDKRMVLYWLFLPYAAGRKRSFRVALVVKLIGVFSDLEETKEGLTLETKEGIAYDPELCELKVLDDLTKYVEYVSGIQESLKTKKIYFRGHSSLDHVLLPGIKRRAGWKKNEMRMYRELLLRCPDDFRGCDSHLDFLVEMQHYGLPTRLLDITENPLVALYFACCQDEQGPAEVLLFPAEREKVKFFNSDTVAILAALAVFDDEYHRRLLESIQKKKTTERKQLLEQLASEVKSKNPAFEPNIDPDDVLKNLFVSPMKTNRRIVKQEGAFIICGLEDDGRGRNSLRGLRLKTGARMNVVAVTGQRKILEQLDRFGINQAALFPEIDDVAGYIKGQY